MLTVFQWELAKGLPLSNAVDTVCTFCCTRSSNVCNEEGTCSSKSVQYWTGSKYAHLINKLNNHCHKNCSYHHHYMPTHSAECCYQP